MPGVLVLRIGAPLYTANVRTVQRVIQERVATAGRPLRVVIVDATVVGLIPVTVLGVFRELDEQLAEQGVEQWVASLPPRALAQARRAPRWDEMAAAGRLHPTARAALDAFLRTPDQGAPTDGGILPGEG